MLSKTTVALAGLLGLASATLPGTLIIDVVQVSTGTTIGTLTGGGNFSSPGPSYPFRAIVTTDPYSTLSGFGYCTVSDILACESASAPTTTDGFFFDDDGDLALEGTDGTWSVESLTDAAGGTSPIGLPYGIPVYLGSTAAIPVTLRVQSASG